MARKRLISPTFFTHAELYDAEAESGLPLRLAFAALWCQADRRGVFVWKPRELKLTCLPYDDVDFAGVLRTLEEHGFVRSYTADGREYGVIPSFARWQSFHKDERASDAPLPQEIESDTVPARGQHRASTVLARGQHRIKRPVTVTVTAPSTTPITASSTGAAPLNGTNDSGTVARRLTAAANKGIAEQFGEQPVPIRWDHPGTSQAVAAIELAGVPVDEAERWLFDLARSRTPSDGRPPRTLRYYADAVIQAWHAEQAHREAATLPRPEGTGTVVTWDDILRANAEVRDVA